MNEKQLLELLRTQLQAEADAKAAHDRLDAEYDAMAERMMAARQTSNRIHRDMMRTQYRLVDVLRGLPDPGPRDAEES